MTSERPSPKGRGAGENPANRYHVRSTTRFDDGWACETPTPLRTRVALDHPRKAISYNDSPDIPFDRSVNPYRGCEHGCIYCYARPTHAWLDLSPGLDFESRLFARPSLPRLLIDELSASGYRPAPLAIGGITDGYQPIEREYQITRAVLETLAETRHPTLLVTKSAMIERDIDLLAAMAADGLVEVAVSLTTLDRGLARRMEPRAASPQRRLQTVCRLSAAGIPVRLMLAPIVPVLTEAEIERLLAAGREAGARHAGYVLLRLPREVAGLFRRWLDEHFPDAAARVMSHVNDTRGGRDNDGRFGHRMRGAGHYASLIEKRFALASRRLGFVPGQTLRSDLFRPPHRHGQLPLL
jgi:DNA repair photolyase